MENLLLSVQNRVQNFNHTGIYRYIRIVLFTDIASGSERRAFNSHRAYQAEHLVKMGKTLIERGVLLHLKNQLNRQY